MSEVYTFNEYLTIFHTSAPKNHYSTLCFYEFGFPSTQDITHKRDNIVFFSLYSNILAWKIPWTEEPGGLQFMWLQRVGHK